MYPIITLPFFDIKIYTFGLGLSLSFVLFYYMLGKLSKKTGINSNFFFGNAVVLVLATFLVSRLVFVLTQWRDYKYLFSDRFLHFFLMTDYNLSFIGGVFGFVGVIAYKLIRYQQEKEKYIDTIVLSFLFAATIGYLWAFFGGQIYGQPTSLPIGIIYRNEFANIPYTSAVVPLAIIYAVGSFLLFSVLYILKELVKIEGLIGFIGVGLFSIMLLIGEFFSGNDDVFTPFIHINLSQIGALLGIIFCIRWMRQIYRNHP